MAERTTLHIKTSIQENYGSPDSPHWKMKGEQVFTAKIDFDDLMYDEEGIVRSINRILKDKSTSHQRFFFRELQPVFHQMIDISRELDQEMAKSRKVESN